MDHERLHLVAAAPVNRKPAPAPAAAHKKRRSHSRGNSITNFDQILSHPSSSSIPSPPLSRSSSHRRRSSVSTRRESAEIMGASLPDDAANAAGIIDSNKVDMHLRALFALEGRSTSPLAPTFGFTKVELPDFGADLPVVEKKPAAAVTDLTSLPSKPSFNANNSLAGKRDSFGKLLTPAFNSKKELQTLLEEDEGEGDEQSSDSGSPVVPVPAPRHRPRSLNLRSSYLRLSASLPTPSPTPSVRTPKLKSLTLASSTVVTTSPPRNPSKRSSALVVTHSSPLLSAAEVELVHRHSSISYRHSEATTTASLLGLPTNLPKPQQQQQTLTPSPSPTLDKHRRSLSPTELLAQSAYFSQSHASFLARIAELEAALARSTATPSPAPTEPSEELLEMLADLKAERDLLKRSLDDLITRYNDQEKQINALGRRLDNEKRDGWVSKEKLARAETEKRAVVKENESLNEELASLKLQLQAARTQAQAEKDARLKTERELYDALEVQKAPSSPYPYPTSYSRMQNSIDQSECQPVQAFSKDDEDSDASFHSRSVSSVSYGFSSRQPSSINTPDDSQRDLASGWSFAKATKRVKPKPVVDNFFTCLDDSDSGLQAESSVGIPSLKSDSSPGVFSIGFGFSADEDEDSTFNFGQPASPSPFPRSDESDDELPVKSVEPVPFIDDDDAAFSFATPDEFLSSPTPSLSQVLTAANTPMNRSITHSPPPAMPNFSDPTTPRPRHKARDSMHLRRRSRNDRQSVDLSGTFSPFIVEKASSVPRSAPPSDSSFTFARSPSPPVRQPTLLDIAIPSGSIGSSLPSFDLDVLSPPPVRKPTSPTTAKKDEGGTRRPRMTPPVFVPSPPPRSSSTTSSTGSRTRVSISRSSGSRRLDQQQQQEQHSPPTPPPSTPSRSPLTNLSFAALTSLFPASWTSPRSSLSASSPGSPVGRDSLDRAYVSRERQLNRLRSESMGGTRSRSQSSERGQIPAGAFAL